MSDTQALVHRKTRIDEIAEGFNGEIKVRGIFPVEWIPAVERAFATALALAEEKYGREEAVRRFELAVEGYELPATSSKKHARGFPVWANGEFEGTEMIVTALTDMVEHADDLPARPKKVNLSSMVEAAVAPMLPAQRMLSSRTPQEAAALGTPGVDPTGPPFLMADEESCLQKLNLPDAGLFHQLVREGKILMNRRRGFGFFPDSVVYFLDQKVQMLVRAMLVSSG